MAKRIREKSELLKQNKDTRPYASVRYVRLAPTKAKIVIDQVKKKNKDDAVAILANMPHDAAKILLKVVKSAGANAENNNGMNVENLYVEECYANKGPTMKRIKPRAQGRAYRIEKRMSHITIVLDER